MLSTPLADESFIFPLTLPIPFVEILIGDIGSLIIESVVSPKFSQKICLRMKREEAWFKALPEFTSLSGSSLVPDKVIGKTFLGFIVCYNFLGLFLSMCGIDVRKKSHLVF